MCLFRDIETPSPKSYQSLTHPGLFLSHLCGMVDNSWYCHGTICVDQDTGIGRGGFLRPRCKGALCSGALRMLEDGDRGLVTDGAEGVSHTFVGDHQW